MSEQTFLLSENTDLDAIDDWCDATWPGRSCSTYVREGHYMHIDASLAPEFYAKWQRQSTWMQPDYDGEQEEA